MSARTRSFWASHSRIVISPTASPGEGHRRAAAYTETAIARSVCVSSLFFSRTRWLRIAQMASASRRSKAGSHGKPRRSRLESVGLGLGLRHLPSRRLSARPSVNEIELRIDSRIDCTRVAPSAAQPRSRTYESERRP